MNEETIKQRRIDEAKATNRAADYFAENHLLKCPFCGSPACLKDVGYIGHNYEWVDWVLVGCGNDDCHIWTAAATPALALAKWNRRA